ncbi:MAG TPA: DUF3102 domain-containing protein [Alphaproteobacteria bacterium]|nr:DUF3102 domain-containing protein [Alphaproteobacteria bacterium]
MIGVTRNQLGTAPGINRTGRDLRAAKAELPHGEFGRMVEEDLPFSWDAANRLMQIARHPELTKPDTYRNLPSSWNVLGELAKLSAADFRGAVEIITPETSVRGAQAIKGAEVSP